MEARLRCWRCNHLSRHQQPFAWQFELCAQPTRRRYGHRESFGDLQRACHSRSRLVLVGLEQVIEHLPIQSPRSLDEHLSIRFLFLVR